MQAVSIHVVDVANGVVARDMRVDVARYESIDGAEHWAPVVSGRVGPQGVVDGLDGPEPLFDVGVYLTVFGAVAMLILALEGDEPA